MSRTPLFLTLMMPLLAGAASAAPEASTVTPAGIFRAQERLNFTGTLLVNEQQKMRVYHRGGQRQRQEYLGADGHITDVVTEDGTTRWHYMPRTGAIFATPSDAHQDLEKRINLINRNYRFQVLGQARRAARIVLLTQFIPIHKGNPTHRLWVDLETRLPLAIERRAANGNLLDRSEYTQIDYATSFKPELFKFEAPSGARVQNTITLLAQGSGKVTPSKDLPFAPTAPRELPQGYDLIGWQYFLSHTGVPTFHWRYHDGLNTFSIFATDRKYAAKLPLSRKVIRLGEREATLLEHDSGRLLSWQASDVAYTAVGHLSTDSMLTVAKSTP